MHKKVIMHGKVYYKKGKYYYSHKELYGGDIGQTTQDVLSGIAEHIPIVGDLFDPLNAVAQNVFGDKRLESAKLSDEDKYTGLFKDNQYVYNNDGSLLFPKKTQDAYLLLQQYTLEHGFRDAGYGAYYNQVSAGIPNFDDDVIALARAHGH